jgi:acetyltransferase-like isoleucine patch superfamily enzyme
MRAIVAAVTEASERVVLCTIPVGPRAARARRPKPAEASAIVRRIAADTNATVVALDDLAGAPWLLPDAVHTDARGPASRSADPRARCPRAPRLPSQTVEDPRLAPRARALRRPAQVPSSQGPQAAGTGAIASAIFLGFLNAGQRSQRCARTDACAPTRRVRIGRGVRFHLAPGATLTLEDRCEIGADTRFQRPTGQARIGAGAQLGERCVVAAHERVEVGAGATLDDEVAPSSTLDHGNHRRRATQFGCRSSSPAPVVIGETRDPSPAGATVLRGVVVGAGARVQPAHGVVHARRPRRRHGRRRPPPAPM